MNTTNKNTTNFKDYFINKLSNPKMRLEYINDVLEEVFDEEDENEQYAMLAGCLRDIVRSYGTTANFIKECDLKQKESTIYRLMNEESVRLDFTTVLNLAHRTTGAKQFKLA